MHPGDGVVRWLREASSLELFLDIWVLVGVVELAVDEALNVNK